MEEFFKENYSFIIKSLVIIAAITGLLLLKKYKHTTAKYFIYFLVYVVVVELVGGYPSYVAEYTFLRDLKVMLKGTILESNRWWYTVSFAIGSVVFFSYYYRKILKNKNYGLIIKYTSIIFYISSIFYTIINWDAFFNTPSSFIRIFAAAIIILCTFFYFIEILQSSTVLVFYKSINFYISITLFIWWLVITPLAFYDLYFTTADWTFVFLRDNIYIIMNIFMYTSFTLALIFCKPENDINFRVKS